MKQLTRYIWIFVLFSPQLVHTQDAMLRGPYFGQIQPGEKAEIFAPGMLSHQGRYESGLYFSGTGRELHIICRDGQDSTFIVHSKRSPGGWVQPERLENPDEVNPVKDHQISIPFGDNAYLEKRGRFVLFDRAGDGDKDEHDLFMAIKKKDGSWSEPLNLGPEINTSFSETHPSLSPNRKYLFFSRCHELNEMADIYWINADLIYKIYEEYPGAEPE